ncbi:MAG TPA: hypothetical protein VH988_06955 [Thermoanaerobaculia bacterium]|nr:hypothetical protein [Thermoanaerobaculia bacterium]
MISIPDVHRSLALASVALLTAAVAIGAPRLTSVYTSLDATKCRTVERHEAGASSAQRCSGVAGYHLLVLDDDNRMSITVEDPKGGQHPLELWTLVSSHFSTLGKTAEWRVDATVKPVKPAALIVRFNAADPETTKETSSLAVIKLSAAAACLVDVVPPGKEQNQKAQESADTAQEKPCRTVAPVP